VGDGFLNRMIVFMNDGIPAVQTPRLSSMPEGLLDRLRELYGSGGAQELLDDSPHTSAEPTTIRFAKGVWALFQAFSTECDQQAEGDASMAGLWMRGFENSLRVAGVVAVGMDPVAPWVQLEQAEWAIDLVRTWIRRLNRHLNRHMAESTFDAHCKRTLEYIRTATAYSGDCRWRGLCVKGYMPRGKLMKLMKLNARDLDAVMHFLIVSEQIEMQKVEGNQVYLPRKD
jgi:hypothetical protein